MLVTVIATLCLAYGGECIEVLVTDQVTMEECSAPDAELKISQWYALSPYMEMSYHLAGWRCQVKRIPIRLDDGAWGLLDAAKKHNGTPKAWCEAGIRSAYCVGN